MKNNKSSILITLAISFVFGLTLPLAAFAYASPAVVNLGTAANFRVLAKSGISTSGTTLITGDIGVSPIDHTALTGFSQTMDGSNQFSTSVYVVGKLYAADYTSPTPTTLGTAVSNMAAAYTDATGRPVDNTNLTGIAAGQCVAGTCDLTGLTLTPGVYTFSGPGNVVISGNVTLNGGASDVWIFQIPGTLDISSATKVLLTGGAVSANVFWAVAGATTLETTSTFEGNILEVGSVIAMQNGATLHGRALSQFAVTLIGSTLSGPAASLPLLTPTCTLTANPTSVQTGSASTLSWTTANTSSFSIDNSVGIVTPTASGSSSVSPLTTTTYSGTATGAGGSAQCSATVTVTPTPSNTSTSGGFSSSGGRSGGTYRPPATTTTSTTIVTTTTNVSTSTGSVAPKLPNTGFPPEVKISFLGGLMQKIYAVENFIKMVVARY